MTNRILTTWTAGARGSRSWLTCTAMATAKRKRMKRKKTFTRGKDENKRVGLVKEKKKSCALSPPPSSALRSSWFHSYLLVLFPPPSKKTTTPLWGRPKMVSSILSTIWSNVWKTFQRKENGENGRRTEMISFFGNPSRLSGLAAQFF